MRSVGSRQAALDGTYLYPSVEILRAMPHLISHSGHSGLPGLHYQDDEILGACCCTQEEACLLYWAMDETDLIDVLEIGSYVGWSTAHLAMTAARVYAIEPGLEHGVIPHHLPDKPSPRLLTRLTENLAQVASTYKWADAVTIIEGCSPEAIPEMDGGWGLAFVDGWHQDGQPLRDVQGLEPLMADDGVMVLHDMWVPDVQAAGCWLIEQGWHLHIMNTANYLTFAWKIEPAWMPRIQRLSFSPAFFHPAAHRQREKAGITALEELQGA